MTALDGAPTAIEPSRVLVLDDAEQRLLLDAMQASRIPGAAIEDLYFRLMHGEEYNNEVDELTRQTFRKRRLEAELRRINARIEVLTEIVVDSWAAEGISGLKHEATGASLSRDDTLWAKLDVDTSEMSSDEEKLARAAVKARAGQVLQDLGLEFVKPDFNLNTLSAYFRELVKNAREAERAKPEHERRPIVPSDLLPDELRGLIRLNDKPSIKVNAG